ncbi:hypothetical protein [Corynebacterium glutamicum]|uniref:hypothetical protein n=1 Tax=Corynebacterium glutamicum TaxID=1718 RepID=UPI0007449F73|nr:hypothetical protein [Corynebacterium glutamicum]AMA00245.1 hypothetical protein APT58_08400 [Corynebacterium glutamicum]
MSFTKEFFKACIQAGVTDLILYGEPSQARLLDTGEKGLIVRIQGKSQEVIELIKFEDVKEVNVRV